MYQSIKHIYFVGIGGAGMSGIAEVLLNLGYRVSGSDLKLSETTERLQKRGATVFQGHHEQHVTDVDVVVTSSAVKTGNPEVIAARSRAIPVIPRAEMLAELMRLKYGIAVAGAHGKTTTTSLIGTVLDRGGISPTVVIGGKLNTINTNTILGSGDFMVVEADESDGSFLKLSPTIAVVTNIDPEHLDHYGSVDEIKRAFITFTNKIPFYGLTILCLDNQHVQDLIPHLEKRYLTYGLTPQADLQACDISARGLSMSFKVLRHREELGTIELPIPGVHNVLNALAAIATAMEIKLPFPVIQEALKTFGGVQRRFQLKGTFNGINLIDDRFDITDTYLKTEISKIRKSLQERYKKFMGDRQPIDLKDKTVIIVDDGIATGNTIMASIRMIRAKHPRKIVVAVPVAPDRTASKISELVDDFICVYIPEEFFGVGQFYRDFSQVSDEEVIELMG